VTVVTVMYNIMVISKFKNKKIEDKNKK